MLGTIGGRPSMRHTIDPGQTPESRASPGMLCGL